MPQPNPIVASIPASTPFVGPETLERQMGQAFELRLGANESLFGPSPSAIRAMQEQAAIGQFYGDPEGYELRSVIARVNGCGIENVILGSGIDELLMLFCRAYLWPGDVALTTSGSYPTFEYCVKSVGAQLHYSPYSKDLGIDLGNLASLASTEPAKMVYVANPDNPSGSWHAPESIIDFRKELPSETPFLLDEAYSDFSPESFPFDPNDPCLIRFRTFSKGHGLAGLRIGYALCHADHISTINKIRLHFGVNSIAQAGALASLQDESYVGEVVKETRRVRGWLAEELRDRGIGCKATETNFILIDLESKDRAEACLVALREQRVFVRKPMLPPLDRYIRVSIGPESVMKEFLVRLESTIP